MRKEEFLEEVCKRVMEDNGDIETVVVAVITKDDTVETVYSSDKMAHKILAAGIINQDAIWQAVVENADADDDDEMEDNT